MLGIMVTASQAITVIITPPHHRCQRRRHRLVDKNNTGDKIEFSVLTGHIGTEESSCVGKFSSRTLN